VNEVSVLVISDTFDFTSDYICLELRKRNARYFRLNRDKLSWHNIEWDVNSRTMKIEFENESYAINEKTLNGIYYRAPTYLRETFSRSTTPEDQLSRSQWMAFVRNMATYENCVWVNNPTCTYKAENKIYQLALASDLGFRIPITRVINYHTSFLDKGKSYIVKSIDTAILAFGDQEGFVYSNIVSGQELLESNLAISPVVVQEHLFPKVDLRITVAGSKAYAVEIRHNGEGVQGDWRKLKNKVNFLPAQIPNSLEQRCISLVKHLGLQFGAIDLILHGGEYYFLEINPTGEWAWLVDRTGMLIYEGICDLLV
jgi:glutathione synthase/RimK-type ligase-like ATP-grasp enzyme